MFVKLFNARMTDYVSKDKSEAGECSQRSSMTQEDSLSYQLLSAHISPCSSPAIRETDSHSSADSRQDRFNFLMEILFSLTITDVRSLNIL